MTDRFLKYNPTGVVFIFDSIWANNPDFVEVLDAQGTPFPDTAENPTYKSPKRKIVPEVEEEISDAELALQADSSRKLPK